MKDRTILICFQKFWGDKNEIKFILRLYNGYRSKDICELDEGDYIYSMNQMYDDNIIAMNYNSKSQNYFLKIFKINEAKIEIVQTYKWEKGQKMKKMYKLFEDCFIIMTIQIFIIIKKKN